MSNKTKPNQTYICGHNTNGCGLQLLILSFSKKPPFKKLRKQYRYLILYTISIWMVCNRIKWPPFDGLMAEFGIWYDIVYLVNEQIFHTIVLHVTLPLKRGNWWQSKSFSDICRNCFYPDVLMIDNECNHSKKKRRRKIERALTSIICIF